MLLGLGMCLIAGCGAVGRLEQLIQPPQFEQDDRPAELRLVAPSSSYPAGGAGVTIWIRANNPNPFSLTLRTVTATLSLDGNQAATGNFPLGLPLTAGQGSVVPIDLTISFANIPALADVVGRAAAGGTISYQLHGTIGVDAGRLAAPTFGPMLLARGELGAGVR
jgi:hypothetical protein